MPRPLEGRRVLVTRPGEAGEELALMLAGLGAEARALAVIEIAPLPAPFELDAALHRANALLLTSKQGLRRLLAERPEAERAKVAHCAGAGTAAAARAAGFPIGVVAEEGGLEALVRELLAEPGSAGLRLFWPASALSEEGPLAPLSERGVEVYRIPLYEPRPALAGPDFAAAAGCDVFVFASPSAVSALLAAAPADDRARLLSGAEAVAIGATTARALADAGWRSIRVARRPDNEGLLAACLEHLAR